ncbi:MAG: nucleotidyltransferase domain-containing protein [Sphingobacteriaceae bacterium]|nr:nucleotidyltransferase domain-containing protein [Sphingobacteriaceae bacterium]
MQLSQTEINYIKQYFITKPVMKAYLFGSYSRGEADANSDIDILVELDYSQKIGWDYFVMKDDLEEKLQKKVDIVSSRGLSKYIMPYVEKEKQLIYEK